MFLSPRYVLSYRFGSTHYFDRKMTDRKMALTRRPSISPCPLCFKKKQFDSALLFSRGAIRRNGHGMCRRIALGHLQGPVATAAPEAKCRRIGRRAGGHLASGDSAWPRGLPTSLATLLPLYRAGDLLESDVSALAQVARRKSHLLNVHFRGPMAPQLLLEMCGATRYNHLPPQEHMIPARNRGLQGACRQQSTGTQCQHLRLD